MKILLYPLLSFLIICMSCKSDDDGIITINPESTAPQTSGIGYVQPDMTTDDLYNAVKSEIISNANLDVVAEINHSVNAENAGLNLDYTRAIYFTNIEATALLMENNMKLGLDLPMRVSIYNDTNNQTTAIINSTDYLENRFSLDDMTNLQLLEDSVVNLLGNASGGTVNYNPASADIVEGTIFVLSENDFDTTYNNIVENINGIAAISIIAEIDHSENASTIGINLPPAKLLVFGNPSLGTPLMNDSRTISVDLPQKMLIYQNSIGAVNVIYNDPYYLADRHNLSSAQNERLSNIADALAAIAEAGVRTD